MAGGPFRPSPVTWPAAKAGAEPRFVDLIDPAGPDAADAWLAGVPYDVSVLGRKGAKDGPTGIREAFRFLGTHDVTTGRSLTGTIGDLGDVDGLDATGQDVLAAHGVVARCVGRVFESAGLPDEQTAPVVLLGGDHGLTFPHVQALASCTQGRIGLVVIDAHYDLRSYQGQPSSGTPFRRILTQLEGRVRGANLVEVGIRPFANAPGLARYAAEQGVTCITADAVRERGIIDVAREALEVAGDGVEHLWLSIDIDGFDQAIASGCSAPGAGGLAFHEGETLVRAVAADGRCRGMDILEVAPGLDPTGNTCRTAAQLVPSFLTAAT